MRWALVTVVLCAAFAWAIPAPAAAQGTTTSTLSGTVVDEQGGAIPGATITARHNATNAAFTTVSGEQGTFSIPALAVGTYTVTVELSGFKTAELQGVTLNAGVPASVRAILQVGGLEETVVVSAASSIVQTQSSAISQTINTTQISNLPLTSRSVLDFVVNLPGVNTPAGSRASTINGLPQSTINITLDGINVQDNTLKTTDGFFSIVSPRLDAIEEVTVSTAAQGAESSGQGAVQIKFVTRSGSNAFSGSGYHYYRSDALNANTWFNIRDGLPKEELLQNQPGVRVGGPVILPGLFDGRDRLFFFVNYEEFRQPRTGTENRSILSPAAQAGIFRYDTGAGIREVNLLELAARNGLTSTMDPTIRQLLADIRSATATTGAVSDRPDPNLQRYSWNVDVQTLNRYPTVRLDWNVSSAHRLSGSSYFQNYSTFPDTLNNREARFPGFPIAASQTSRRLNFSTSLRSTLSSNLVNDLLVGGSGAPVLFFSEMTPTMWTGDLANQGGFNLNLGSFANITDAGASGNTQSRNAYTFVLENTLNWLKGKHSINVGGSFNQVTVWLKNQNLVPTMNFGVVNGDPAESLFTSANFPGSSSRNRNDAQDLYALLTGRVSSIGGEARLDEATGNYVYQGPSTQRAQLRDYAFWVQDSWRARQDLTFNFGLRYELQAPFASTNDSYSTTTLEDVWGISGLSSSCTDFSNMTPETCNLFKPGLTPGKAETQYFRFDKGVHAYDMDLNNFAPSVGFAWTPSSDSGLWRTVLGQAGDTVIRGGFARAFNRPGMSDFTGRIDDNPGIQISANRSLSDGNLGSVPLLFRDRSRLGPPDFPATRVYPMTDSETSDVNVFDPHIQVPYADSWTFGVQRAISRNMAVEVRYVGTRSRDAWTNYNINEVNIHENGFLDEFRLAQANLRANLAADRGATFAYMGPGTGTSPLPIFLAYFSGSKDANNPARYTSSNFRSSTFINPLAFRNPNPFSAANALDSSSSRRQNALRAGLAPNFLVANPNKLGGAEIVSNGGYTNYNSMQFELRRRMANGLQFEASYVWGRAYLADFYSFRRPRLRSLDTGGEGGVTHAFKLNWVYELPFGRGKRFGSNVNGFVDRLIGGWQFHGLARVQSGQIVDFGNVRMVGFTHEDLKDFFKIRIDEDQRVWMLPEDVIENTVKAFSVSATSDDGYSSLGPPQGRYFAPADGPDCMETISGSYGDCGTRVLEVAGPLFKVVDLSIAKLVPIAGRVRAEFRFEMLNAFNWVNFDSVTGIGSDPNDYEVNGLNGRGPRVMQIVSRISW